MSDRFKLTRPIAIGLLSGVAATLAMGQAAAPDRRQPQPQPVQRYQISAGRDNLGNEYLFILDHQTQRVYRRSVGNIGGQAQTIEQFIQASN